MTYSNFQENLFGEALTSSQEDSPASHSHRPESERAEPMNDISFRKCFELFERSNRVGSSLKMFAACLVSSMEQYSPKLSHHWKAKATRSLRFVFLLQPSRPRTGETDCGSLQDLLPTASARDWKGKRRALKNGQNTSDTTGTAFGLDLNQAVELALLRTQPPTLREQIGMLPTPTTHEIEHPDMELSTTGRRRTKDGSNTHSVNLADTMIMLRTPDANMERGPRSYDNMKGRISRGMPLNLNDQLNAMDKGLLPTPQLRDYRSPDLNPNSKRQMQGTELNTAVAMIPTPRATMANGPTQSELDADDPKSRIETRVGASTGLRLQPGFALWMMGYPETWCDLEDGE